MIQEVAFSVGGIVFVVYGLVTMKKGWTERAQGERIAETETTQIRDLQPGPVEVTGTARPTDDATALESPFSNTDALAVHVEVEEWDSGNWRTVFEAETAEPMAVDDGTGEALVELPPAGGLDLEGEEIRVDSDDEPPAAVRRYVENETDLEIPERRDFGPVSIGERRRYREGVLEPGEEMYVRGSTREATGWDRPGYVIDEPTESGDFVLSNTPEAELIAERTQGGLVFLAFGGLLTAVGAATSIYPWLSL